MNVANCEKEHLLLKIENSFPTAFPCIKNVLFSANAIQEIRFIQNRLLTFKELTLHQSILDKEEISRSYAVLTSSEKKLAKKGVAALTQAIDDIDTLIEQYHQLSKLQKLY
ncbi:hypothetical protein L4C33_10960 [Vibrio makurazakiensis]|uniref:hypothetical protein n=1 Tax=Vibrio makurazakiensis TaxID=2910250 RepID=UPI003D149E28